jgi:hypothetical protein
MLFRVMEGRRSHGLNFWPLRGRHGCPDGDDIVEETNSSSIDAVRDVGGFSDSESGSQDIGNADSVDEECVQHVHARRVRDRERKRRSRRRRREDQKEQYMLIEEDIYEYQN